MNLSKTCYYFSRIDIDKRHERAIAWNARQTQKRERIQLQSLYIEVSKTNENINIDEEEDKID